MEVNMNRLFGLLFALFFVFYCKADNLSVPMAGNGNGKYLNSSVQILGDGTYDAASVSVISTGNNTAIKINSVNLGDEIYTYNSFSVEYTNPQELSERSFFDIFLEDAAEPITSVPVEKTMTGEYKTMTAKLSQSVLGKHNIYIRWRGHNSSLRTFIVNELTPMAEVPLVRSFSTKTFKFSKAKIGDIEGVHQLKMLWKNQNAVVKAVYLDKINEEPTSINLSKNDEVNISLLDKGFRIVSKFSIGNIELYSISGEKILELRSNNCVEEVFVVPGVYVLKIVNTEKKVIIRKLLI